MFKVSFKKMSEDIPYSLLILQYLSSFANLAMLATICSPYFGNEVKLVTD